MDYPMNKIITAPNEQGDGISFFDGKHHELRDCVVDFSAQDLSDIDEALGITWGSSAMITDCVFRGAGKLVLCGSGDTDKKALERGKVVTFRHCLFENFGRRGPEVQDGMRVYLENCVIRNWGYPDRFTVRSFGAWAHGTDSLISAINCVFWQENKWGSHPVKDLIGHIGQAYNDTGLKGFFSKDAWRPGNWRGLVASDGGIARAYNCYVNHDWITVENCDGWMSETDAISLVGSFA